MKIFTLLVSHMNDIAVRLHESALVLITPLMRAGTM